MTTPPPGTPTIFDASTWRTLDLPGDATTATVSLRVGEVRAEDAAGAHALLVAGVHGDEGPWGGLAIREALTAPTVRLRGSLTIVLAANPLAIRADARNAPQDGLDLNRTFPGDDDGTHTQRLAAALAPLVRDADVVVDLHGGGSWCVNAFAFAFPGSERLAALTRAPFVMDAGDKPGTLTQYAIAHGAHAVAIEMGGRSRDEIGWARRIARSVDRILVETGTLFQNDEPATDPPLPVRDATVLRPPSGGVFVPTVGEASVGTIVEGGTELGRLVDAHTHALRRRFTAPYPRTALLLLRPHVCVLDGGDMTYVVARPQEDA